VQERSQHKEQPNRQRYCSQTDLPAADAEGKIVDRRPDQNSEYAIDGERNFEPLPSFHSRPQLWS